MKILIADDHDLLRDTLKNFLETDGQFDVALGHDLPAALDVVSGDATFDLILLDFGMPGMDGFRGLEQMVAAAADTPVALMSGTAPPQVAHQALDRGAIGFLPKTMAAKSLANAIRLMAGGERYMPVGIAQAPSVPPASDTNPVNQRLTPRERHVLSGLCEGKANKEIARDLDLREPTVKLHVKTICRKLKARNRTHAAIIAKETGFSPIHDKTGIASPTLEFRC